ncbi:uncharacterized protein LOC116252845 [Nymphaea colorata]|nr:uncharacterized protein LOC116252845 [Nymphaea colorata]XP_031483278.1 uncharacterized protein LOC116252845 [Nymphaea colorata]XP_031483279.1 uncharacterized protein LOC116252845 [Nymphaea colorata]XP_031483280.1 uncharacterized protein LOC116252845 [Nymphaea colorata]XP_031483281.1 uncharacterized protein LOC116252845 [Nymphaea colorata]XP_031483282.1 uncharacterized protein LOC116252845 [Nymphaea colorata]XP_031483283.1 uncharacterized protein LOC116252845 [Nymphaea colorata]XP_03148328
MFTRGSVAQPRAGLTASGALSHAYVQYPPLRCTVPGAKGLFYDDGNKLLLSPTSDRVYVWQTGLGARCEPPNSDSINDGPVLSIRYSLDGKVIGIHRSNHEVEFKNRETGAIFYGKCKSGSESILGFFWTDCPTCDVVFIKTSGLDLYACELESNMLRLVETKRLYVSWYVYTHESRLVLLASGMQCKSITGYQFSAAGIIHLPKFEMTMTKAEVNKKPILAAEDVHIITVYGRIYCLQVDWMAMLLRFYRFYRDAVIQQGSFSIYSTKVAVSVVDNVLLVHQVDAKVVLLYDIFLDSQAPVSAPLPLLVRGLPVSNTGPSQASSKQEEPLSEFIEEKTNSDVGTVYGESWNFLVPDLICDAAHGTLWKISLDLEAIATSTSDVPSLLEFLQRRRSDPSKIKELCEALMRTMVLERRPVFMVARAMDVLTASYSHAVKLEGSLKGGAGMVYSERSPSSEQDGRTVQAVGSANIYERRGMLTRSGFQGRILETDPLNPNLEHDRRRLSMSSTSDNDDNLNLEILNLKSEEPLQMPLSSGLPGPSTKDHRTNNMEADAIYNDFERTSLQPETSGTQRSLDASPPGLSKSRISSVAISPEEMYTTVFSLVEEEMVGDPAYLVAVIMEYLKSTAMEKLKVPPDLYVLTIQLLTRNEHYAELGQFIRNQVFEPSKQVALQLLGSGNENFPMHKLGVDMLRKLSLHHDYALVLLRDGYYLEALRYIRRNKVYTVRPSLFLEAAVASNKLEHLASSLRFFLDFKPDFRNSSDYNTFSNILNEMSSSVK